MFYDFTTHTSLIFYTVKAEGEQKSDLKRNFKILILLGFVHVIDFIVVLRFVLHIVLFKLRNNHGRVAKYFSKSVFYETKIKYILGLTYMILMFAKKAVYIIRSSGVLALSYFVAFIRIFLL